MAWQAKIKEFNRNDDNPERIGITVEFSNPPSTRVVTKTFEISSTSDKPLEELKNLARAAIDSLEKSDTVSGQLQALIDKVLNI